MRKPPPFRFPVTFKGILIICGLSMLLINACRKMDRQIPVTDNAQKQKFFYSRLSTVPLVKAVVGYVYRQNQKYHFLPGLVNRIGYPYWNKAMVFSGPVEYGRGQSDSADIVYIPFVRESENFVNAALIVKFTDQDTAFKILCDWQYKNFGFEPANRGEWNAWSVFQIFASLDSLVFDRKHFQIIDERLLTDEGKDSLESRHLSFDSVHVIYSFGHAQFGGSGRPALMVPVEVCSPMSLCLLTGSGTDCGGGGCNCEAKVMGTYAHVTCCLVYINWQVCWYVWVDYGDDGGGGGGEPGGGGGGNPWEPPSCGGGSGRYYVIDPCSPGWIPIVLEDPPNNPEPIDSVLARLSRTLKDTAVWIYDNLSQPNNIEHSISVLLINGQQVPRNRWTNNDSTYVIPRLSVTAGQILLAIWHSHVSRSSDPSDRRSFSAADINLLRDNRCLKQNFVSFADCRNKRYALVITDLNKATAFFNNNNPRQIEDNYFTTGSGNMQEVDERCIKNVIGSVTTNGIGFYISTDAPDFQTWTLLNQ
jgi:hypothetical protein